MYRDLKVTLLISN